MIGDIHLISNTFLDVLLAVKLLFLCNTFYELSCFYGILFLILNFSLLDLVSFSLNYIS